MSRFHIRFFVIVSTLLVVPLAGVEAAFVGPSQSPPAGNVPGVIWNRTTVGGSANEQAGTDMNISGSARFGGDAIFSDGKALRIDQVGTANLYIGNWGNGVQGLTVNVNGDLVMSSAGTSEGKVTAPKFCLGVDCITQWPAPVGGGITAVTADTGLTGGGNNGVISVAFDTAYGDGRYVNVSGDQMQGALQVPNPPIAPTDAAPKAYVDDLGSLKINKSGDTMGGALMLNADPVAALEAATKQYVDTAAAGAVSLSGGTMSGLLTLSGDPNPLNPNGAVTVNYFNNIVNPINAALFNYVLKAGDTMSGTLTAAKGIKVTGTDPITGSGLTVSTPGATVGATVSGVTAINAAGTNFAFLSSGVPQIGINIPTAAITGGVLKGTSYGVDAESQGVAGMFINLTTPSNIARLADGTYAGGFYSAVGTTSLYAQRNVLVGGDIVASSNALSGCVWTAYIPDGSAAQCAAATPIMSGVQRLGANTRIYCCAL